MADRVQYNKRIKCNFSIWDIVPESHRNNGDKYNVQDCKEKRYNDTTLFSLHLFEYSGRF